LNSNDSEDLRLIEEFQTGNKKSFGTLFEKYRSQVFLFFTANGIPTADALDACQDIFINLLKYLKDNRLNCTFKIFLNQIIRNRLADYYRQKKRRANLIDLGILENNFETDDMQTGIDSVLSDDNFEREYELAEIMVHCLKKIKNERWRTVLTLWVEQYKREQISEMLETPIGSVCSCLSRLRPVFLDCIKKHFFEQ
jgi:RNA polymerase sigma factor (sigma-70 family)